MNEPIKVEKTLTINKPAAELYRFWRNFGNLPHFMKHLRDVKVYDAKRSHWTTSGLLNTTIEWDAVITEDRENELIAWASVQSADIDHSGSILFQPTVSDRGTEVKVVMEYKPPGGVIGDTIAKLFGDSPKQQLGDDLRRFKMLMETGEIATTEGQSRGHS
ncbi:SRPBCC family protein [Calothrix sp. PCC 6303]|uniref:SRPBCC family protein n=1 Tax=Calothrix sp. PCC 6303 TaxID=1170562 RepID=UPI0002A02B94|nr:SRPBCC family protein [Calothrix sp. PCC 6303]AFZ02753.1 cyclase/dehydrase [Calothrix sp. PCC 6303]